jgi:hypothetical protein
VRLVLERKAAVQLFPLLLLLAVGMALLLRLLQVPV